MAIAATGTNYIDALQSGLSWTGNAGQAATIGYSFNTGTYAVPAAMQGAFTSAMQAWANVANITFQPVSYAVSVLDFYRHDLSSLSANTIGVTYTYTPSGTRLTYEQVIIDDRFATAASVAQGTQGYVAIMHEIGHALGIEHPGAYSQGEQAPHLPGAEDNLQNTIMSYFNSAAVTQSGNPPITPMIYDIAAIQYLYGANTSYNAGSSYYVINASTKVQTLWDGGGTDMLSANGVTTGALLDLREGINNYSKVGNAYTWVAFNANIEDAQGGSGADTIHGNDLGNTLYGATGNDVINGYESADLIFGEAGTDNVDAGTGNDYVQGGLAADTILGSDGNDTIHGDALTNASTDGGDSMVGGLGADSIWAGGGNDTAYGDAGNDVIYLDSGSHLYYGNDLAYGGADIDVIVGEGGIDTIYGGDAYDVIYGDNANATVMDGGDLIYGEGGNDVIWGGGGNDTAYGGVGNDVFYMGTGNDSVFGEDGIDVMIGDIGNDTLAGGAALDYFYYGATHTGADVINSYEGAGVAGGDIIRLASANMNGNGLNTAADVAAAVTYSGGNAHLDLGGGITITIVGVAGGMIAGDFMVG